MKSIIWIMVTLVFSIFGLPHQIDDEVIPPSILSVQTAEASTTPQAEIRPVPEPRTSPALYAPSEVKSLVKDFAEDYKVDFTLALAIAYCESGLKQEAVHKNDNSTHDGGVMQINDVHLSEMEKIGLDRSNVADNVRFGMILLSRNGTRDYIASAPCWKPIIENSPD